MAVIRETVFLRRRRNSEGQRQPNRIKLEQVGATDSLIVEVVIDRKNDIRKCYRFRPDQLLDRKAVTFTVSGSEVYWLRGLQPDIIDPADLPEDPRLAVKSKIKERTPQKPDRQILVFDSGNYLDSIHRDLASVSKATNILVGSIEKLCKKKRPSQETGLSFRFLREKFCSDDRIISFQLTLAEYDEMCKRGKKNE